MFSKRVKNPKTPNPGDIKLLKFAPIENFFSPSPLMPRSPLGLYQGLDYGLNNNQGLLSIGENDENWSDEEGNFYQPEVSSISSKFLF